MSPRLNLTYTTALVLQALSRGFHHGFDIMDATGLPSGTVYPILRRLDREGLLQVQLGRARRGAEGTAAPAPLLRDHRGRGADAPRRCRTLPDARPGGRAVATPPEAVSGLTTCRHTAIRSRCACASGSFARSAWSSPRPWRADWRDEWEAEFRHRHTSLDRRTRLDWRSSMDLVRRAFGALPDAAWLRRQFTADAEIVHDVRHGMRMLRKSPTFTAAAVVTLALGIGGTVAIATLLDTLFFRALPYADAERIVTLWQRPSTGERDDVAPANFLDWRERSRSFEQVAAAIPYSYDYTGGAGEPEVFFGAQVTEGFWEALGVRPAVGRFFRREEHARGSQPVAIITHAPVAAAFRRGSRDRE